MVKVTGLSCLIGSVKDFTETHDDFLIVPFHEGVISIDIFLGETDDTPIQHILQNTKLKGFHDFDFTVSHVRNVLHCNVVKLVQELIGNVEAGYIDLEHGVVLDIELNSTLIEASKGSAKHLHGEE